MRSHKINLTKLYFLTFNILVTFYLHLFIFTPLLALTQTRSLDILLRNQDLPQPSPTTPVLWYGEFTGSEDEALIIIPLGGHAGEYMPFARAPSTGSRHAPTPDRRHSAERSQHHRPHATPHQPRHPHYAYH